MKVILPLIILMVSGLGVSAAPTTKAASKNILFVSSYSYDWPSIEYQLGGINDVLGKQDNISISYEFLNTKKIDYNDDYKTALKYRFDRLFSEQTFDGMIVGDDDAINFVDTYHDDLFATLPIVFIGANSVDYAKEVVDKYDNICGIIESVDYTVNLDLAFNVMSKAKTINYIVDQTNSGVGEESQFLTAYNKKCPDFPLNKIDVSTLTQDEIATSFSKIDKNDITFFLIMTNDKEGNRLSLNKVFALINENISSPTFRSNIGGIGECFIGGYVYSFFETAQEASNTLLKIINKETTPSQYGVNEEGFSKYIIDKKLAKEFGLDFSKFPSNTTYVNDDLTFEEEYPVVVLTIRICGFVLLIVITFLVILLVIRNSYYKKIKTMAEEDSLTGIKNRDYLYQKGKQEIEKHKEYAILVIYLMNFRTLNDLYGYEKMDAFLKEYTRQLCFYCGKDNIYSLSRTEYVMILPNYDRKEVTKVITSFILSLQDDKENQIHLETKIGVALAPKDGTSFDDLLTKAQVALSEIQKQNYGMHFNFYDKKRHLTYLEMEDVEKRLHKAVNENRIYALFQPKVDLDSGKIVGYEALARVKDGTYGPGVFIPVAEKTGLMWNITEVVVEEAISLLRMMKANNLPYREISINYSLALVSKTDFIKFLVKRLDDYHIPHEFIKIELTESLMFIDLDTNKTFFDDVVNEGFKISLDDFGNGFSSLNVFLQFPFSEVKLDKEMSKTLLTDEQSLVELVNFFKKMNVGVVFEGIETKEQIQKCKEVAVNTIQGYYFYHALDKDEIIDRFNEISSLDYLNC